MAFGKPLTVPAKNCGKITENSGTGQPRASYSATCLGVLERMVIAADDVANLHERVINNHSVSTVKPAFHSSAK